MKLHTISIIIGVSYEYRSRTTIFTGSGATTTLMTPLATMEGIEPPPRGLEALVLPLHYTVIKLISRKYCPVVRPVTRGRLCLEQLRIYLLRGTILSTNNGTSCGNQTHVRKSFALKELQQFYYKLWVIPSIFVIVITSGVTDNTSFSKSIVKRTMRMAMSPELDLWTI